MELDVILALITFGALTAVVPLYILFMLFWLIEKHTKQAWTKLLIVHIIIGIAAVIGILIK